MCGRFTLIAQAETVARTFGLCGVPRDLPQRYNIAPTQLVASVRLNEAGRELSLLRWGLIPSWAADPAIGNRLINARAETAAEKPSFRSAFRARRCLVPTSGYYEWQKIGKVKQPYFLHRPNGQPVAFAGLWEEWHAPDGGVIESCTFLTTEANASMRPFHDRMPVILAPVAWDMWLDTTVKQPRQLQHLLCPVPDELLTAAAVSTYVNDPRHEGPRCVEPFVA